MPRRSHSRDEAQKTQISDQGYFLHLKQSKPGVFQFSGARQGAEKAFAVLFFVVRSSMRAILQLTIT